MRAWDTNRALSAAAVLISLGLTALTVSAVVQQGRALEARQLDDVRQAGQRLAGEREQRLRDDLERAFAEMSGARAAGRDGLDAWLTQQRLWRFAWVEGDESIETYPLTPTEAPLPLALAGAGDTADGVREAGTAAGVPELERLADAPERETRAAALLALAATQRRLGAPRTAARTYQQAAGLLAVSPRSPRGVFGALLAAADCHIADGDAAAAARLLLRLAELVDAAHPAAWGAGELTLLQQRVAAVGGGDAALAGRLAGLTALPPARAALPVLRPTVQRGLASAGAAATPLGFALVEWPEGGAQLVVLRGLAAGPRLALAVPLADLLEHYWSGVAAPARWQLAEPDTATTVSVALGEGFGRRLLVPSSAALAELQADARKRVVVLATVTAGMAGAWGVVVLMLFRVLARQRELVQMQRQFMADVSHELKTPLALIRLHAETLAAGRVPSVARAQEYYDTIARESERLSLLLDNILDFSRIESGRKRYELSPCDVGAVARQAWTLFVPRFQEEGFAHELAVADDLPPVLGDAQALGQVVVNLLQNAHRYSPDEKRVTLRVERAGDSVVLSVTDRGLGMSRGQIRRLGRSFERGADPRVRRTRGTGLGLAIVRHIIAAHRGVLDVRSEPGKGSTFTVRLPVAEGAA